MPTQNFITSPVHPDAKLDRYGAAEELAEKTGGKPLYMTIEAARAKLHLASALYGDNICQIEEFLMDGSHRRNPQ